MVVLILTKIKMTVIDDNEEDNGNDDNNDGPKSEHRWKKNSPQISEVCY